MEANKSIREINFWKRSPTSVETVEKIKLTPKSDKSFAVRITSPAIKNKDLSVKDSEGFLAFLNQVLEKNSSNTLYEAFRYENNTSDFNLKFFLEVDYSDYTYQAIKGIHPFKQPCYQEVMKYFGNLIEK